MSRMTIEANLRKALIKDGPLSDRLFEYELREHVDDYMESKRIDGDKYFIAITENSNEVSMLLIDEEDQLHINDSARSALKKLWPDTYRINLKALIPDIAIELSQGHLYACGVRIVG